MSRRSESPFAFGAQASPADLLETMTDHCICFAVNSTFSLAFRRAIDNSGSAARASDFESSVVEIRREHLDKFLVRFSCSLRYRCRDANSLHPSRRSWPSHSHLQPVFSPFHTPPSHFGLLALIPCSIVTDCPRLFRLEFFPAYCNRFLLIPSNGAHGIVQKDSEPLTCFRGEGRAESQARSLCLLLTSSNTQQHIMSTSAHSQKRVAFLFLDFLKSGIADGSIRADDAEGIEVASELASAAHRD